MNLLNLYKFILLLSVIMIIIMCIKIFYQLENIDWNMGKIARQLEIDLDYK